MLSQIKSHVITKMRRRLPRSMPSKIRIALYWKSPSRLGLCPLPHAGAYPFALTVSAEEESTDTGTVNIYVDPGV